MIFTDRNNFGRRAPRCRLTDVIIKDIATFIVIDAALIIYVFFEDGTLLNSDISVAQ